MPISGEASAPVLSAQLTGASIVIPTPGTWVDIDDALTDWVVDEDNFAGFSTALGRYTAPKAGRYLVNFRARLNVTSGNTVSLRLIKNATPYGSVVTAALIGAWPVSAHSVVKLAAGDTLKIQVNSSAGTQNVQNSTSGGEFVIAWIGP